ncbi:MAG: N-6 DNA methylase [Agathobacter sp.]|nr:N-6 DNA methylase [Agathobacter sp.]
MAKPRSYEEDVEDFYKAQLKSFGIKFYTKTESVNASIDKALVDAPSKSGNSGKNYPDIKILLQTSSQRFIPIMVEAKGAMNKLIKDEKGEILNTKKDGKPNYTNINGYAVNGAIHYANAILNGSDYNEVIAIGLNGWMNDDKKLVTEFAAYYISNENGRIPKKIEKWDDFSFLKPCNVDTFVETLDNLLLTEEEVEKLTKSVENTLEEKINKIHQSLYENNRLKSHLSTNQKLYLFCGLIMAGLKTKGVTPLDVSRLHGDDSVSDNDGVVILTRIRTFLEKKNSAPEKIDMIINLLKPVFEQPVLWKPIDGESILKELYRQIKTDIIPCLESNLHLDFTGKILNSLGDWVHIENDKDNDVVLTPRYVTKLMVNLAHTNKDSYVWDTAMGSAGFLVSAMEAMIKDAHNKIVDKEKLDSKIKNIKENQLLGIEILGNIYILAVLNMILMGDGSSNIINGDSFQYNGDFSANVFLLNPPYSQPGHGLCFVEAALTKMINLSVKADGEKVGYACVLIQESAGAGQGGVYAKQILSKSKLIASVRMPIDLFGGKASVPTAIYLFEVGVPHDIDDEVIFIDFSKDGYTRLNRKGSSQKINLRDTDDATGRYAEIEAIILGKKPKTSYYTDKNGLLIKDTITLEGNDWTYIQHKPNDTMVSDDDLQKAVADYLSWKVSQAIKEE